MKRKPAFTLIELLLAIFVIAILSMTLLLNFSEATLNAQFDNELTAISRVVENARAYTFSNYLVNDDPDTPAEYFLLSFTSTGVGLGAVAEDGTTENLMNHTFNSEFILHATMDVYYFPPDGTVCFSPNCSDHMSEVSMIFADTEGTRSSTITINVYGGYVEIEDLL